MITITACRMFCAGSTTKKVNYETINCLDDFTRFPVKRLCYLTNVR